jgi:outer membrane protein assembly factor BamB
MPHEPPPPESARVRWLWTIGCPPAALFRLWRRPAGTARKLLVSVGLVLLTPVWLAGVIALLVALRLVEIEWKGGTGPRLVHRRTVPDFDALEASRRAQVNNSALAGMQTIGSAYWTGYRGPNRDGHYTQQPILTAWPKDGPKLLWRQPCGGGYASFAIAGGRAFTLEQRREQEAVIAYDVSTGRELWAFAYPGKFNDAWNMGYFGPRSTPAWDDGRVFAVGAEGRLHCLEDATGRLLWKRDLFADNDCGNLDFGMAASPLVVGERLIVVAGKPRSQAGRGIAAYDKATGEPLWKSQSDKQAYVSPMLVTLAGRPQVLVTAGARALGLAPEDGRLLWEFPWSVSYDNHIGQPVLTGGDRVFFSAGYGAGCVAVQVTREADHFKATELWRNKNLKNKFTSSVSWEGHIYGLDEDMLVCLDAATGARKWKDGRYGYGQVLLASGHLIVLGGEGDLALVKAAPDAHTEVARVPALNGKTWNVPALADGRLLVRNGAEMACYDVSPR